MTEKTRAYKRLTPAQWSQIVVLWELGEATYEDLAETFEVSVTAIRKGLKARGSVKGSRAHEIGKAAEDMAKTDASKKVERIQKIKEKYLGWSDLLGKLTMKEVGDAVKDGLPISSKKESLVALNKAVANIKMLRDENFHLLGLYDENTQDEELPELVVGEYTAEELEAIQTNFDKIEDDLHAALGDDLEDEEEDDEDVDDGPVSMPFGDE